MTKAKNSRKVSPSRRPATGAAVMSSEVTQALTRTFFDEWSRKGYTGISLERVARMAGVGKAALYRRWPDKPAMASDLLSQIGLEITAVADQGSLGADILALLLSIRRVLRHPTIRRILADLHAELDRTPALANAVRPFQRARRTKTNAMIDRAVARGELHASVDREMVNDLIGAPLYWRIVVLGGRADRARVEGLAKAIEAAVRSCR